MGFSLEITRAKVAENNSKALKAMDRTWEGKT
jgi:hypothetical protein